MYGWRIKVFLGARIFSTLGDQLLQFAVPLIVFTTTGSVALAGLAFLVEWLPRLISLPFAGLLSDRFGGRPVYVVSDSVRAVACLLTFGAVSLWPGQTFAQTAALMALCAFCYAQTFIALETTIPQLVATKDLPKAQSLLQMINNGSGVLGPALGGVMLIWVGPTQLLWVAGAAFAVGAVGVIFLKGLVTVSSAAPRRSVFQDLQVGVRSLARTPILISLVGLTMVVNLMVGLSMATSAALTVGHFRQDDSIFASLQITVGVLSIVTLLLMPWLLRRVSVYRIGTISFALITVGGALVGLAPSFALYVLGYGMCIGLCGLFNVFIRVERLHWIAEAERGRVISVIVLLNQSTMPLAGLLVAVVGGWLPVQALFVGTAVLAVLAYLVLLRPLRSQVVTGKPREPAEVEAR